jgi:DNA-binding transcriptional regulator YiaG
MKSEIARTMALTPAVLRDWQKNAGLTSARAASLLGVPLRTYQDWKSGAHLPRGFALKQLRDAIAAGGLKPKTGDEPRK